MEEWTDKNGDVYRLVEGSEPARYELVKKAKKPAAKRSSKKKTEASE